MACGNNDVRGSALQSQPQRLGHPGSHGQHRLDHARQARFARQLAATAAAEVTRADARIQSASSLQEIAAAVSDAKSELAKARRSGDRRETSRLERQFSDLVRRADSKTAELQHESDARVRAAAAQSFALAKRDRLAPQNLGVSPRTTPPLDGPAPGPGNGSGTPSTIKSDLKQVLAAIDSATTADEIKRHVEKAAALVSRASQLSSDRDAQSLRDRLRNIGEAASGRQLALELLDEGGRAHVRYADMERASSAEAETNFGEEVFDAWADRYRDDNPGADLVTFTDDKGFTYLFDTGRSGDTAARVVGVFGHVADDYGKRDTARMNYQQLKKSSEEQIDRGHMIAHQLGGSDEAHNVVGQVSRINRQGPWRELERELAKHPGQLVFVRAVYDNDSDRPAALEHGHIGEDCKPVVAYFANR